MKKILCLLLAVLILSFAVVSCAGNSDSNDTNDTTDSVNDTDDGSESESKSSTETESYFNDDAVVVPDEWFE